MYSDSPPGYLPALRDRRLYDVTDHPFGKEHLAEVRNNYTNPYTKTGPIVTYCAPSASMAKATPHYRPRGLRRFPGVGSPDYYIQSF